MLERWCAQTREAAIALRNTRRAADLGERVSIVNAQTAAERALCRIQIWSRKEFQRQTAAPQDHPAAIPPRRLETERSVKACGHVEVTGGQIGGGVIRHGFGHRIMSDPIKRGRPTSR